MALNHNQYAVAAIAATLCLAGIYTVIGAAMSSTDTGGFDSAVDDIFITPEEAPKECPEDVATVGCDWDGDGFQIGWNKLSMELIGRKRIQMEMVLKMVGKLKTD